MPERRRKFTPEFRDEAVKMVIESSRPIAEVAREIHVVEGTLGAQFGGNCAVFYKGSPHL